MHLTYDTLDGASDMNTRVDYALYLGTLARNASGFRSLSYVGFEIFNLSNDTPAVVENRESADSCSSWRALCVRSWPGSCLLQVGAHFSLKIEICVFRNVKHLLHSWRFVRRSSCRCTRTREVASATQGLLLWVLWTFIPPQRMDELCVDR